MYAIAARHFSADEIAEAFAATSSVTVPGQLRSEMNADGRDLVAEFRCCVTTRPKVSVQRWTIRRVGLAVWLGALAATVAVLGFGNLNGIGLL